MEGLLVLVLASAAVPLAGAWLANRATSLAHAVAWSIACWGLWLLVAVLEFLPAPGVRELRYLALCLTGCCGVAVLGARRPVVQAWDFVVLGLLVVLALPLAEGMLLGSGLNLDGFRLTFLGGTLAVGILNYLPTRMGPAALLTGMACLSEIVKVQGGAAAATAWIGLVPWCAALLVWSRPRPAAEFDRLWLGFRDRYGLVWGKRLQDQFNSSAVHAAWPVVLRWRGLRRWCGSAPLEEATQRAIVETLRALMKRFGPAAGQ